MTGEDDKQRVSGSNLALPASDRPSDLSVTDHRFIVASRSMLGRARPGSKRRIAGGGFPFHEARHSPWQSWDMTSRLHRFFLGP